MGTRSWARFIKSSGDKFDIISIVYHQYDGYPEGVGNRICKFLLKYPEITDILKLLEAYLSFCQSEEIIHHIEYNEIYKNDITDDEASLFIEWVYDIYLSGDNKIQIKIFPGAGRLNCEHFCGTVEEAIKWISNIDNLICNKCKDSYQQSLVPKRMMTCDICNVTKCNDCDILCRCECNTFLCDKCNTKSYCIQCDKYNCSLCELTDNHRCKKCVRKNAASFIQLRWRWIICRPKYKICENRLFNEFSSLVELSRVSNYYFSKILLHSQVSIFDNNCSET